MIIWIQCSKANFRSITDRSVTSRRLRVDRGRLYTPQCCCMIVLFTLGSSVFALSSRCSPTRFYSSRSINTSFFTFNPGLIPWRRLTRFFNFSEFLKQPPFFFGLSHPCSAWRVHCSTGLQAFSITIDAPSTAPDASPSCSRPTAASWHIQVHAAIDAETHLSPANDGWPETSASRTGSL